MVRKVVLDCETTGLGPNDPGGPRPDGVISVGLAWEDAGGGYSTMKFECHPGESFFVDGRAGPALKVNGYTLEQVRHFEPVEDVARRVLERLIKLEGEGPQLELLAYNAPFDKWFVSQLPWVIGTEGTFKWGECLMKRAIRVLNIPTTNGHLRLATALKAAGLDYDGKAHDAIVDAVAELKLARRLDELERASALKTEQTPEDFARDVVRMVMEVPKDPLPRPQGSSHDINPSRLDTCLREVWLSTHGGTQRDWSDWRWKVGMLGNAIQAVVVARFREKGLRVIENEFLFDPESGLRGRTDFRFEFPKDSGQWTLVELKSTSGKMENTLTDPKKSYLYQCESYCRMSGYSRIMLLVFGLGYNEKGEMVADFYEQSDDNWKAVVDRASVFRGVMRTDAPKPPCECGRCPP